MRKEVRLEHIREAHDARQNALDHFERIERSNKRQEYDTIRAIISPKLYDDKLYLISSRTCEGTGKWLLKDPGFIKWLDVVDESVKFLWLQGIPGAGQFQMLYQAAGYR